MGPVMARSRVCVGPATPSAVARGAIRMGGLRLLPLLHGALSCVGVLRGQQRGALRGGRACCCCLPWTSGLCISHERGPVGPQAEVLSHATAVSRSG